MSEHRESLKIFNYDDGYAFFSTRLLPIFTILPLLFILFIIKNLDPPKIIYLTFCLIIIAMLIATIMLFYAYPNILIKNDNIILHSFFKTFNITPNDIINIVEVDKMFKANLIRVDISNLTIFHRIIGLIYGSKGLHSIIIRKDIKDYHELLNSMVKLTGIMPKKQFL